MVAAVMKSDTSTTQQLQRTLPNSISAILWILFFLKKDHYETKKDGP